MDPGAVRAVCFDLDNTLWAIEPVLARAERILADWLRSRYPRLPRSFSDPVMVETRATLLAEEPQRAHDLTYLRRETLARVAMAAGHARPRAEQIAREAFSIWHAARNECAPYDDVLPALAVLSSRFRLATLTNGNADLARIGLAHHFEINLHAGALGCAKPDARAYLALAASLTLQPAEILFVGDDPHADVVGPRAAGMQTVWVNRRESTWPAELAAADAVVSDLAALVRLLNPA